MAKSKKRITLEEARKLYPDEWVVFVEPRIDTENTVFQDGVVLYHGKDREEAYRRAASVQGPGAIEFTGTLTHRKVTLRLNEVNKAAA